MQMRLYFEPLTRHQLNGLAQILRSPLVYQHIDDSVPTAKEFVLGLEIALAGPPVERHEELWLNYLVRLRATGETVGRLEATVHDSIAEVAVLLGPAYWGNGYATEALEWLHGEVVRQWSSVDFWATTAPKNERSQSMLRKCGYQETTVDQAPSLRSYVCGDRVFHCRKLA